MCKLAIIGGDYKSAIKKYAQKLGIEILFHDGRMTHPSAKYRGMIRQADVVTLIVDALNHNSMNIARNIAKEFNKPIVYSKGKGILMAVDMGLREYEKNKKLTVIYK